MDRIRKKRDKAAHASGQKHPDHLNILLLILNFGCIPNVTQKKILKKQKPCFEDMPIIRTKKNSNATVHKSGKFFRSHPQFAAALLQSLEDNDADEILAD